MTKKFALLCLLVFISTWSVAQNCNCETEFNYIESFMAKNYAGFKDKKALMTDAGYEKLVNEYRSYTKGPHSDEKCLLIITQFLNYFKDHHVSVMANFDPYKKDSVYLSKREIIPLSDEKIADLRKSRTYEGIYNFHDSAQYKIAVIKDKTPLHDYIGIIINSNVPGWKRGMIKFEGKMMNDSVATGVLYILNGMPKMESFYFWGQGEFISGDWVREGAVREKSNYKYEPVASRKLSEKTLYIKISNFYPSNAKNIDSVIKLNAPLLKAMPNLVLDLRGNGGGADFTYGHLLKYVYTNPFKDYGNDLWATDATIAGWKKYLEDKDLDEGNGKSIRNTIAKMEAGKGGWVVNSEDEKVSRFMEKLPSPQKIVVLIDGDCASTTEQFLLFARHSTKVILGGQNTSGTLDYSNVVEAPFSCMPYILKFSSSRSRRIDHNEGIDNTGIKPDHYFQKNDDWLKKAQDILEK